YRPMIQNELHLSNTVQIGYVTHLTNRVVVVVVTHLNYFSLMPVCCSVRCTLAIMTLLQITLVYMLRVEVSVAIVEMMNDTLSNSTLKHDIKKVSDLSDKVYDWSSETQGWILSAFYYGYIVSQIPGGYLAMRFGGKLVLGFAVLLSSVSTLPSPTGSRAGRPLCDCTGPCFPAVHHIWSQWAPAHEQSRFINLAHSGSSFGTVISFVLSGLICYHLGWSYSFYIFGSLGIAWCLVWSQLVSDAPETHRTISDAERDYIISSRLKQASTQQQSIPWESILKSSAVWAIIAGYLSGIFIFYTLIAVLPTYMQNIFQLTIQQNGFLSALQLMPGFLFQNIAAVIADYMKKTGKFSTSFLSVLGMITASAFLIAAGYVKHDYKLAVTLLTICITMRFIGASGIMVNDMDIILVLTFKVLYGLAPPYLCDLLTLYQSVRSLRSLAGGHSGSLPSPSGTPSHSPCALFPPFPPSRHFSRSSFSTTTPATHLPLPS
uniref:Major facilitator superfamily (MFS) profile domain-containing protein n=1 Tax=Callorhinchus milii TaxID=7868 RepID=A0A4W3JE06_CALMI